MEVSRYILIMHVEKLKQYLYIIWNRWSIIYVYIQLIFALTLNFFDHGVIYAIL